MLEGHVQAAVVGGMLLDIQAGPKGNYQVVRGGSVPGYVLQTPGGVGRNIADCLAHLCRLQELLLPALVSVLGQDAAGDYLLSHWAATGSSVQGILRVEDSTPTLCAIIDRDGEVVGEIASVDTLEACLTPAFLQQQAGVLSQASLLILDANLPPATLQAACALPAPQPRTTWFEPVSAAKAVRGVSILAHLDYISPNLDELVAIAAQLCPDRRHAASRSQEAGWPPQDALQHPAHLQGSGTDVRGTAGMARAAVDGVRWAIVALLQAGVQHVVLTLGPLGAALCSRGASCGLATVQHLPAAPAQVVSTSGAGDCLVAGCAAALLGRALPIEALASGLAVAGRAVECRENVPHTLDMASIQRHAGHLLGQVSSWQYVMQSRL